MSQVRNDGSSSKQEKTTHGSKCRRELPIKRGNREIHSTTRVNEVLATREQLKNAKKYPDDKKFKSPPFSMPPIDEKQKLNGRNYKTWINKVYVGPHRDEGGNVEVSPALRVVLDAQTLQYLKAAVNKSIVVHLEKSLTAYQALNKIKEMFEKNRMQDLVNLHERWFRLTFKIGYDPIRFIATFNRYVEEYQEVEINYTDEYLMSVFLTKIEGIYNPQTPYFHYYSTTLNDDTRTLKYVQERFLSLDHPKNTIPPLMQASVDPRQSSWNKGNNQRSYQTSRYENKESTKVNTAKTSLSESENKKFSSNPLKRKHENGQSKHQNTNPKLKRRTMEDVYTREQI